MAKHFEYDAIVVGSGPNGLAAAITLAETGRSVLVFEAKDTIGGGTRSQELTLPGFIHDVCSAIHPLAMASPFFRNRSFEKFGLEWIHPELPLAHPLDGGQAAVLDRSLEQTAAGMGVDAEAYRRLYNPFLANWEKLVDEFLGPLPFPPKYPLLDLRFGLKAIRSARGLANQVFKDDKARALFAGIAAHSIMPLERIVSASFGLIITVLGHAVGWPMARGGSQQIASSMAQYLESMGGKIETGYPVQSLIDLPPARAILLDITPQQFLAMAGERLSGSYRRQLERYRYGPGVFKVDWALNDPIPWKAPECHRAGTVHVGGRLEEVAVSEHNAWVGRVSEKPFVLVAQQSLFDASRAPNGKHTAWGYCHVPNGCNEDMTARIEAQIERFAPGFRDCILARSVKNPAEMQAYNANYIGGDINGGVQDLGQLFTRPAVRLIPYTTPIHGVYLCSSSTPPGGGVHGMSGYHAAQAALKRM